MSIFAFPHCIDIATQKAVGHPAANPRPQVHFCQFSGLTFRTLCCFCHTQETRNQPQMWSERSSTQFKTGVCEHIWFPACQSRTARTLTGKTSTKRHLCRGNVLEIATRNPTRLHLERLFREFFRCFEKTPAAA